MLLLLLRLSCYHLLLLFIEGFFSLILDVFVVFPSKSGRGCSQFKIVLPLKKSSGFESYSCSGSDFSTNNAYRPHDGQKVYGQSKN